MLTLRPVAAARVAVLTLLVSSCLAQAVAASSLLLNGSFELHSADIPGSGELLAGSTQVTGWTVTGTSNSADMIDWLDPGSGPQWLIPDGTHMIDLDGRNSLNGGIYQTFATTVGQLYLVSFDLSGNPGDGQPGIPGNGLPVIKQMRVTVGGVTQDYQVDTTGMSAPANGGGILVWQRVSFAFVALNAAETLAFTSLTPTPNSYGALIDDVTVDPTAAPVPEPASLLLLGTGVLGAVARRSRSVLPPCHARALIVAPDPVPVSVPGPGSNG